MADIEITLLHIQERVSIFKIPPVSTAKGFFLDDWKDMIWEGACKVTEKNNIQTVSFISKDGQIFAGVQVPKDYNEGIQKTNDSQRGYAVRLQNPQGGFMWVGVAFRDRNSAFDFGACLTDFRERRDMEINPEKYAKEFEVTCDFNLKQGEKISFNLGTNETNVKQSSNTQNNQNLDSLSNAFAMPGMTAQQPAKQDFSSFGNFGNTQQQEQKNDFADFSNFGSGGNQQQQKQNNDFANFGNFGSFQPQQQQQQQNAFGNVGGQQQQTNQPQQQQQNSQQQDFNLLDM